MKQLRAFVSAASILLVGLFIVTTLFSSAPASELHTVSNESVEIQYETWQALDGADIAEVGFDNESVYNSTGNQLNEGDDYEYEPDNTSIIFYNTTNTSEFENASATYSYKSKPKMARTSVGTISDAFVIAVAGLLIIAASVLLSVTAGMAGNGGFGGGRR